MKTCSRCDVAMHETKAEATGGEPFAVGDLCNECDSSATVRKLLKLSNADLMAEIVDEESAELQRDLSSAAREAAMASERLERAEQRLAEVRGKIVAWCEGVREDLRAEAEEQIGGEP